MASTSGAQDNNAPAGGAAAFLAGFQLVRVLSQDAKTRSAALLGTLPAQGDGETVNNGGGEREQAIVLLEKTHFEDSFYSTLGETEGAEEGNGRAAALEDGRRETKKVKLDRTDGAEDGRHDTTASSTLSTSIQLRNLSDIQSLGHNDIYTWLLARIGSSFVTSPPDVKLTLIRPATSSHIEKHSAQEKIMVYETPQMYSEKTLPWISAQDPKRIQWVYNILEGKKEQENVVYRDEDPMMGFVLLPDLKWDRKTLSSLYLQAIVQDRSLRSLRDLTPSHSPLLRKIRSVASQIVAEKYGLGSVDDQGKKVRCFLHYHPSYYHLHVHVLSADYTSHAGAIVGQAHLLDDVIDLLELGVEMKQRTIGCALGARHELLDVLRG